MNGNDYIGLCEIEDFVFVYRTGVIKVVLMIKRVNYKRLDGVISFDGAVVLYGLGFFVSVVLIGVISDSIRK